MNETPPMAGTMPPQRTNAGIKKIPKFPNNPINPINPGSDNLNPGSDIPLAVSFSKKAMAIYTEGWEKRSAEHQKQYKQFLQRADKNKVLKKLPALHAEAFEKIDCLQCANCCKNYSPRFKTTDIKRISKYMKMKEGDFIETYLLLDADGDYVAKSAPCPFLGVDNCCSIYEERPGDCSRFPYTNEDVLLKRPQITLKNATFCPIVHHVMERLIEVVQVR